MTRPIKFRVWDEISEKYLVTKENDLSLGLGFSATSGIGPNNINIYNSVNTILEQFTGLKDKNGKELYVGDIVNTWVEGTKQADPELIENMWDMYVQIEESDSYYAITDFEVIGNIHDNKDLLEKQ